MKGGRDMKKLILGLVLFSFGCTTPTAYHQKVTVQKDADGNVVSKVIEEEITQPYLKKEVQEFKYLEN